MTKDDTRINPIVCKFAAAMIISLFVLILPGAIWAQSSSPVEHRAWEAAIFGGGSFIGSAEYRTPLEGATTQASSRVVGVRYASGPKFGLRVTDNRWSNFGASLEYSYSNQPLTFTNLSDSIPSISLGHSIHRIAYDLIYYTHDRSSRLRPYVFGGPGVSLFYIKGSSKDFAAAQGLDLRDSWKFTMNWGGGVKYLLRRGVAPFAQFSDSVSGVPGYGLPKQGSVAPGIYVPGFRPDGLMNNWLIEAGLSFQWNPD